MPCRWIQVCYLRSDRGYLACLLRSSCACRPFSCDPTATFRPFAATRTRLSVPSLRPDRDFQPLPWDQTASVSQKAATCLRLFLSNPRSDRSLLPQTRGLLSAYFTVFEPSPFAAIFSASAQPSVPPAALLPYSLFCNIISVPFYRICFEISAF